MFEGHSQLTELSLFLDFLHFLTFTLIITRQSMGTYGVHRCMLTRHPLLFRVLLPHGKLNLGANWYMYLYRTQVGYELVDGLGCAFLRGIVIAYIVVCHQKYQKNDPYPVWTELWKIKDVVF